MRRVLLLAALLVAPQLLLVGAPTLLEKGIVAAPSSPPRALQAPVALGTPARIGAYGDPTPLAGSTSVQATLTLSPTDPDGLADYAEENPTTPISASQVAQRFLPNSAQQQELRDYLAAHGLTVQAPPNGLVWLVTGPASGFSQAFGTGLAAYSSAGSTSTTVAYTSVPELPSNLPVAALSAPTGNGAFHPLVSGPVAPPRPAATTPSTPSILCPNGSLTPRSVENAYNITPVLRSGDTGQGEKIGIVDAYDTAENDYRINNDLSMFSSCYGLPQRNATLAWPMAGPSGLNNSSSSGWGLEIALDTQYAHATAPNASITLVLSPNNAYGLYYGVSWLIATQSVNVISLSWGEPETGDFNFGVCTYECNATTDGTLATMGPLFEAAAAEGMDTFVASGDCGANGGTLGYTAWYPASDPHVIGVGGTVLNLSASGGYGSETAWDGTSSFCLNGGGSGGGFSVLPRPPWQSGPGFSRFTNTTRGVPDVSLVAAVPLGLFYQHNPSYVEGTSDAAPQWAGMGALVGEGRGAAADGMPGFLAPELYSILRSPAYTSNFHPIDTGWNGYSSGYGWDPVTGIGTPNFATLFATLEGAPLLHAAETGTIPLVAAPLAGVGPLPVHFQAGALGAGEVPSTYTFYYGDTGPPYGEGNGSTTEENTSSYLYPYAALNNLTYPGGDGAYVAFASATDTAGNTTMTVPAEINVGNAGPLEATVTASAGAAGSATVLTATASGGIGPYHFAYFFGDGTFSSSWAQDGPSIDHVYVANGSYLATVVVNDSSQPLRGGTASTCVVIGPGPASCPTVPKTLVNDLVPGAQHLVSGQQTMVCSTITYNGIDVAGASVVVSTQEGSFLPSTGLTNSGGHFCTNYTAPVTNRTIEYGVYANVTDIGFAPGFGEALLLLDPNGGPSLTPWVRFGQSPVKGGSSDALVIGGLVAGRGVAASNASLAVGISGAATGAITGSLNDQGLFATTWDAPNVPGSVDAVFSVSLSGPGFSTSTFRFLLPIVPSAAPTGAVASLSLTPGTTPSMGSVVTRLWVNATGGTTPLNVSVANLSVSQEPLGGESTSWKETAPGVYAGLYSTPITSQRTGEILVYNISGSSRWSNGSAAGLVEVTPGYGPLTLRFFPSPSYFYPGERGNLTVQASSTDFGLPLAQVFMLVSPTQGDPSAKHGNAIFAYTNAEGNLTFPYQAPNFTATVYVDVEAVGFVYNYTALNFTLIVNVSLPQNTTPPPVPGTSPPQGNGAYSLETTVLIISVALLAASLAAVLVAEERGRKPPEPTGYVPRASTRARPSARTSAPTASKPGPG